MEAAVTHPGLEKARRKWRTEPVWPIAVTFTCLVVVVGALIVLLVSFHSDAKTAKHEAQSEIARNNSRWCDQELSLAGLPTKYPAPTSDLGEQLVNTALRIQRASEQLAREFNCPPARP
jgi:hypothetical protein